LRGEVQQVRVFDDFAHHPTAIAKTLAGVRSNVSANGEGDQSCRIIAVLEPRSNTMKSGVHKDTLATSLAQADVVYLFQGEQVKWSVNTLIQDCKQPCFVETNIDALVSHIVENSQARDTIVVMSNGGFGDIHNKLLIALEKKGKHARV
jgi:UDP-N-acetylmuramate: L-alanyl-gamma-D-glutamyl-meso-diaminopimelate ligase